MNFFKARRLYFILGLQGVLLPLLLSAAVAAPPPLITSSVKLRVNTDNEHSWGTGTIIDTRPNPDSPTGQDALIVTCGHIFRESQGQGNVEVHLYGENSIVRVDGWCLFYDLEIDLALVTITPPGPVRAAPIAPENYRIQPSQQTWSVGCDHGGNPTIQTHQIVSVDKFGTSREKRVQFHYVQVSGAPVSGRSGGGLFSAEGYLIGVCNAGDPVVNDGHFVPPHMIRRVLYERNLAFVYENPSLGEPLRQAPPLMPPTTVAALAPLVPIAPVEALPNVSPMAVASTPLPIVAENRSVMSREEQATLDEIERRRQDGDEVIVIFRSRKNPEIPSDVIVMNGASDRFLDALVHNPTQPSPPSYNPVIFSSHEAEQPARTADRQQTSFGTVLAR